MNELLQFSYKDKDCFAILDEGKNPWWVARQVCEILDIKDTRQAVERLDADEKLIGKIYLSGQMREVWLINEPGLYTLVLTSNKPEAKAFKRWITHEVLPSIRKTGAYIVGEPKPLERPTLKEAVELMREARKTFGIHTARRICKKYLDPERSTARPQPKEPQEPMVPLSEYRKVWPYGVTPEEDAYFNKNAAKMTQAERDDFIRRLAERPGEEENP